MKNTHPVKWLFLLSIIVSSNLALGHGMSAEDKAQMLNAGPMDYVWLGASHMLSGYDHLLFLFGVVFLITLFRDILKLVTAFTIGHSITLLAATMFEVSANYFLIDAVIALTVCYKAFDNLGGFQKHLNMPSPNLSWMVFTFGLIHGFGLSTRLQQLPLGDSDLLLSILSFNLGVELGQIAALAVILLVLSLWRKRESFSRFSRACNSLLLLAGALLFLMQMHSYQHSAFPDDFPLNQDDHYHTHEEKRMPSGPRLNYPKKLDLDEPSGSANTH